MLKGHCQKDFDFKDKINSLLVLELGEMGRSWWSLKPRLGLQMSWTEPSFAEFKLGLFAKLAKKFSSSLNEPNSYQVEQSYFLHKPCLNEPSHT